MAFISVCKLTFCIQVIGTATFSWTGLFLRCYQCDFKGELHQFPLIEPIKMSFLVLGSRTQPAKTDIGPIQNRSLHWQALALSPTATGTQTYNARLLPDFNLFFSLNIIKHLKINCNMTQFLSLDQSSSLFLILTSFQMEIINRMNKNSLFLFVRHFFVPFLI